MRLRGNIARVNSLNSGQCDRCVCVCVCTAWCSIPRELLFQLSGEIWSPLLSSLGLHYSGLWGLQIPEFPILGMPLARPISRLCSAGEKKAGVEDFMAYGSYAELWPSFLLEKKATPSLTHKAPPPIITHKVAFFPPSAGTGSWAFSQLGNFQTSRGCKPHPYTNPHPPHLFFCKGCSVVAVYCNSFLTFCLIYIFSRNRGISA